LIILDELFPILQAEDLSLQYQNQKAAVLAVWRLNFTLMRGDRLVLMGESGCGKSTVLKAAAGFLKASEGQLRFLGQNIEGPSPDRFVVWQSTEQLLPWKRILDNIAYPLMIRGEPKGLAMEAAALWMNKVGLSRAEKLYPHQLSGGMKMRAAVARAFAAKPSLLLLDEPFAALDAFTRTQMQDMLLALQAESGISVFFVSHDIHEASRIANRVIILSPHPGRIKAELQGISDRDEPAMIQKQLHELLFERGP
jgi:NitT/TauT family transport system ATP-binding protein